MLKQVVHIVTIGLWRVNRIQSSKVKVCGILTMLSSCTRNDWLWIWKNAERAGPDRIWGTSVRIPGFRAGQLTSKGEGWVQFMPAVSQVQASHVLWRTITKPSHGIEYFRGRTVLRRWLQDTRLPAVLCFSEHLVPVSEHGYFVASWWRTPLRHPPKSYYWPIESIFNKLPVFMIQWEKEKAVLYPVEVPPP
jgi:hypothetical protein